MSTLSNVSDLPEPDNGTLVIVLEGDRYILYIRDDITATKWSDMPDQRWFENGDLDDHPLSWRIVIQYATHVWARGELLATSQEEER